MEQQKFYVCCTGHKGYFTLLQLAKENRQYPHLPEKVHIANSGERGNPEESIIKFCKQMKVPFEITSNQMVKPKYKTFYIGWKKIIDIDSKNHIIIHDSDLPSYTGYNSTVQCLLDQNTTLSSTAFYPTRTRNHGDILRKAHMDVRYPLKIYDAMRIVGLNNAKIIEDILVDNFQVTPMTNEFKSYSCWRDEKDYIIDWTWDAEYIERFVDSVGFPYDGAVCKAGRVIDVEAIKYKHRVHGGRKHCGKVLYYEDGFPVVITGLGLIKILILQNHEYKEKRITNTRIRL